MSEHHHPNHPTDRTDRTGGTGDTGVDGGEGERRDALGPGDTGRWLVITQGSTHIWDLDALTYTRFPGPDSLSGAFAQDQVANPITKVERWPRVGDVFRVRFDDAEYPGFFEQWRQSSWVRSIERLPDDDPTVIEGSGYADGAGRVPVANGVLTGVHPPSACAGQAWGCWIHDPKPHPLDRAPVKWREDKGTAERLCPHGIGHPDPQDAAYWWHVHGRDVTVHGCDGCCHPKPDWLVDLSS